MAIYHMSVKIISRSNGHSSVAASAYRAGEKLEDTRTGEVHNYTQKQKVNHSEIIVPEHCGQWALERGNLWNTTEHTERRKDAQLAREINVAIPIELKSEQGRELVRNYVQNNFVNMGMIADISIHGEGTKNPHAHIMLSTREATPEGLGQKVREWNDKALLESWRSEWANCCNYALVRTGHDVVIDNRSYEKQGIDKIPTIHLGSYATKLEKMGIESDNGKINSEIEILNNYLYKCENEINQVKTQLESIKHDIKIEKDLEQKDPLRSSFIHCYKYGLTPESTTRDAMTIFAERMGKENNVYAKEKKDLEEFIKSNGTNALNFGQVELDMKYKKKDMDIIKRDYNRLKGEHEKTLFFGKKKLAQEMKDKETEYKEQYKIYKELVNKVEKAKTYHDLQVQHIKLYNASPEAKQMQVIEENRGAYNQLKRDLQEVDRGLQASGKYIFNKDEARKAALEKLRQDRTRKQDKGHSFER